MLLGLIVACGDISGQWRDYSFNKAEIPALDCEKEDCITVAAFSLELAKDSLVGDFRIEIIEEEERYIHTLPVAAENGEGNEWIFSVDNAEYPVFSEEWSCLKFGRILNCTINEDLYQLRRGKHP